MTNFFSDAHSPADMGRFHVMSQWDDLKRRRGRFRLDADMIKDSPGTAMRIFGKVIIVRAEHTFMNDAIEYDAYSPLFRVCPAGEKAPFYNFTIDDEGPITAIEVGHD